MDEEEEAKGPLKDPTLALFLGLYLILLAFFVLLNTMASVKEDRVKAVLGSLLATFSTEILNSENPTEFAASVGEFLTAKEFHGEVRDFFEVAIPLAEVELFSAGRDMRISLPVEEVFEPGTTRIRSDREDLLFRIGTSLRRRVEGMRFELEVSTFTGPFFPDEQAGGHVLEIARASSLAEYLVGHEVPPQSILIGAQPGNPSDLRLTFSIRVDSESELSFDHKLE